MVKLQKGDKSTFPNFIENREKKKLMSYDLFINHLNLKVNFLNDGCILGHNKFSVQLIWSLVYP